MTQQHQVQQTVVITTAIPPQLLMGMTICGLSILKMVPQGEYTNIKWIQAGLKDTHVLTQFGTKRYQMLNLLEKLKRSKNGNGNSRIWNMYLQPSGRGMSENVIQDILKEDEGDEDDR